MLPLLAVNPAPPLLSESPWRAAGRHHTSSCFIPASPSAVLRRKSSLVFPEEAFPGQQQQPPGTTLLLCRFSAFRVLLKQLAQLKVRISRLDCSGQSCTHCAAARQWETLLSCAGGSGPLMLYRLLHSPATDSCSTVLKWCVVTWWWEGGIAAEFTVYSCGAMRGKVTCSLNVVEANDFLQDMTQSLRQCCGFW